MSYGSAPDFIAWADARGRSYPTGSGADALIDAAILRGSEFLDGYYRGRWKGFKADPAQAMAWPRIGVLDEEGAEIDGATVPERVEYAAYEAALVLLSGGDLTPVLERGGRATRERVKAGPVESETEYPGGAPARAMVTAIDDLIRGLIRPVGVWLERG